MTPGHLYIVVTPLRMSMDPQNWPCEPVSLFQRLGRVGLSVPSRSHKHRQHEFDPRIVSQKNVLTVTLTLKLTLTVTLSLSLTLIEGGQAA